MTLEECSREVLREIMRRVPRHYSPSRLDKCSKARLLEVLQKVAQDQTQAALLPEIIVAAARHVAVVSHKRAERRAQA